MAARQKTDGLPGMEPKKIKDLEEAADDYVIKRDARMAAGKLEVEAKKKLNDLMKSHQLAVYQYNEELTIEGEKKEVERTVEFENTEKLKVRTEEVEGAAA